jgi:hypothetical protein
MSNYSRIGRLVAVLLLIAGLGCSDTPEKPDVLAAKKEQLKIKIYYDTFEETWRAVQIALAKYPIRINDMDAGVIETDSIKGEQSWITPGKPAQPMGGRKYKLKATIVKGRSNSGGPANRVSILKISEVQKDFFSEVENVASDGMEELSIIYRIDRELALSRVLKRASKK